MNLSPDEAQEALATIKNVSTKTRRSLSNSGAYIFLILTGTVWLVGFLATQFLSGQIVTYIWIGTSILCSILSIPMGIHNSRRLRGPSVEAYAKRIGTFFIMLALYAIAIIFVAKPSDPKQITMLIVLFIMLGQLSMGMLLSFSAVWWAIPITVLALIGYFLLPELFYLWMAILVGGGMIGLGLYIRLRW
jgi:hypothetical protein